MATRQDKYPAPCWGLKCLGYRIAVIIVLERHYRALPALSHRLVLYLELRRIRLVQSELSIYVSSVEYADTEPVCYATTVLSPAFAVADGV